MSQGPVANVVTTASNAVWYTDKCEIVTGSSPVTYQVYATALRDQAAVGNIYSDPASIDANSSQEIYVGVGNYLTITGTNFTAQEIGGQTSAQAGVGGYGINNLPEPPAPSIPTVTSISPDQGFTIGNTSITVTGTNFVGVTGVTVGGNAAANVAVATSTSLTALTPAGVLGNVSVNVTNANGTSTTNTLYEYMPITPAYTGTNITVAASFNTVSGEAYPCLANVAAGWTVNYPNGVSTGWVVSAINKFPYTPPPGQVYIFLLGQNGWSGNFRFVPAPPDPANVTPWYVAVGGGGSGTANIQFNNESGSYPSLSDVAAGWFVYDAASPSTPIATVNSISITGTTTVNVTGPGTFAGGGASYRFSAP